jgi:hypothetical protein
MIFIEHGKQEHETDSLTRTKNLVFPRTEIEPNNNQLDLERYV